MRNLLLLVAFSGLIACAPLRGVRDDVEKHTWERREKAYQADLSRMSTDGHRTYQLDYVVTDEWLAAIVAAIPKFRTMGGLKFDMTPWLQEHGAKANPAASAVYDSDKRTITIIDTGPNATIIAGIIEPMRPVRCARFKVVAPTKP